jgi:hypothetical protein
MNLKEHDTAPIVLFQQRKQRYTKLELTPPGWPGQHNEEAEMS